MKTLNYKKYACLMIMLFKLFIYQIDMYSQLPQAPATALSPNAASLGLYGNIPVSYYTGTPGISIPLYEAKVKDFVLPITLNYHSSGVQVDQRSGWTGMNWSLFAGGLITRTVNDMADDYNNPNYSYGGNSGFYFNYGVLNTSSWSQRTYLRSVAQSTEKSLKDTSPDEFSFSFAGYNGKFYLNHYGNWVVYCDKPVKVEFDGTFQQIPFNKEGTRAFYYGYSPCFSGFTITTEDGTKYQFGKNINAIDFSIDFFNQSTTPWMATAWYLTKIVLPSQNVINFVYERKEFNNQMYIAVQRDLGSSTESSGGIFNPQPGCSSSNYSTLLNYEGKLISPVYLTGITTDNVVISFAKSISNELKYEQSVYGEKYSAWNSPGYSREYPFLPILKSQMYGYPGCLDQLKWYKLDYIIVKDKSQTEVLKVIDFGYNNSSTSRLFLNDVSESGKRPYVFSYYNSGNLPNYLSNKSDHWGYYNNTYASLDYSSYYGYRNPNASVLKYGILTKMTYPTGGYTEFEFEPHYYRKQLNIERWNPCSVLSSNQLAGGLRIKQIKNSSTPQGPAQIVKEYYYVSDYLQNRTGASISSGVLGGQVQYYFTDYLAYAFNDNNVRRKMSVFSSISVLPACRNSDGSHIGYTEVIEKYPDNSFTRYQFTNFDNGYLDEPADAIIQQSRTPYEHYTSKANERGRLLFQEDYNATGSKLKSKNVFYGKEVLSNDYVRAMDAKYKNVCPGTAVSYDEGTSYKIYVYLLRPETETESFYDPVSGNVLQSTTTSYAYTGKKLIRSISIANSNGDINKTEYKYPFDTPGHPMLTSMAAYNILSPPVEIIRYVNSNVVRKDYTDYEINDDNVYYPTTFSVQFANAVKEPRLSYNYHDSYGNPLFALKDNAEKAVYVWGYKGQHIIAAIQNMDYSLMPSTINLNAISAKAEPSSTDWININNLRSSFPNAHVSTFKYKPAVGITESTDPRGITTFYDYDSNGRLTKVYRKKGNVEQIINAYDYYYFEQ